MERSAWRFYPWAIAAGMAVVVAVNVVMATAALSTFPGQASGGEGFDLSNRYNSVIDRVQQQTALGWTVTAEADRRGHPMMVMTDAARAPLTRARIVATADRPVGEAQTTTVEFNETTPGHYAGDISLPSLGQWELLLTVKARGQDYTTTRRIVVK